MPKPQDFTSETAPKGRPVTKGGRTKGTLNKKTEYGDIAEMLRKQDEELFLYLFNNRKACKNIVEAIEKRINASTKLSDWQKLQAICLIKAVAKGDLRAIEAIKDRYLGKAQENIAITNPEPIRLVIIDGKADPEEDNGCKAITQSG